MLHHRKPPVYRVLLMLTVPETNIPSCFPLSVLKIFAPEIVYAEEPSGLTLIVPSVCALTFPASNHWMLSNLPVCVWPENPVILPVPLMVNESDPACATPNPCLLKVRL